MPFPAVGLAAGNPRELGVRVLAAWDAFLDVAGAAELSAPSRLPAWSGRDVCIHLGSWSDTQPLSAVLASARAGAGGPMPRVDEGNARVVAAHRDAPDAEVLAALVRARDNVEAFFDSGEVAALGLRPALSALGPLPVLTVVHAACYELAVHALDLAPCRAPEPPPDLLFAGLGALIDVTGALAARQGIAATVTGQTPGGGWCFHARPGDGWATEPVPAGPVDGTAVVGQAAVLLDVSAGRMAVSSLLVERKLRIQDMSSFLRLAPLVEAVPGIPGSGALKVTARTLSGVNTFVNRLRRPLG